MTDGLLSDLQLYCEWLVPPNIRSLFDYANELQGVLVEYLLSEEGKYGRALESFHRGVWQGRVPSSHLPLQPDSLSKMTSLSAHPEQPLELQYLYTASQLFQESLYETSGIFFNFFFLKCLGAESDLSCRNQYCNATKIPPSSWYYRRRGHGCPLSGNIAPHMPTATLISMHKPKCVDTGMHPFL